MTWIRVLHVFKTYFPETQGGLEEAIRQICRATAPHGFRHTVFTVTRRWSPSRIRLPEAEVVRVRGGLGPASCPISLGGLLSFGKEVRRCHIVHYHFPWPYMDALHHLHRVRKPCLVTYHADIVRPEGWLRFYAPLLQSFLNKMGAVVATSPAMARSSPVLRRVEGKVVTVPYGLDPASYPVPGRSALEDVERLYGKGFFLFVGVLRYYKGLDFLLEAAKGEAFRVVIAGDGPEGERLRRKSAALGLDNVAFAGRVSDEMKMALLDRCRAVVMPSHLRAEAFGISLVEGAMVGKPLVCCQLGTGTTFVNRHGETGLVVPPADAAALRHALRALHGDRELAERLGRGARARFKARLSSEAMGRGYARLYERLLRVSGGRAGGETAP
jgi:rhamnosyl/mannosyltransferase